MLRKLEILKLENFAYLIIFILPAYLIKLEVFSLPTNLLEISIALFFLFALKKMTRPDFEIFLKSNRWLIFFISSLIGGFFISAALNPSFLKSFGIIKGWLVIPIMFFAAVSWTLDRSKYSHIWTAYFFSATAVAAVSIIYLFLGETTYDGRLRAVFNSPNYLAMYLAPGILIGLTRLAHREPNRRIFLIGSVFMLIALYFTFSYAAWLAVFASLFFIFSKISSGETKPNSFLSAKKGVLALILLAALLILTQTGKTKLENLIKLDSRSSLSSRMMIWRSSFTMLEKDWLGGIGPANFQTRYLENQKYFPPYLEWAVPHPHNLLLAFWLSGGLLGFFSFLGLVYHWFKNFGARKNAARSAALGIMLYILFHGLIDTTYFKNDLAIVFWLTFLFVLKDQRDIL